MVVVTMHAGAEGSDQQHVRPGPEWFLGEPRGNVVAFSHAVVRAGATSSSDTGRTSCAASNGTADV